MEVSVYNNKAKIPNELLMESLPITVIACIGSLDNAKAISRRSFRVLKRPKPESYYDDPDNPDNPSDSGSSEDINNLQNSINEIIEDVETLALEVKDKANARDVYTKSEIEAYV